MEVTMCRSVKRNLFIVTIKVVPSKTEQEKLKKFGDPLVQIGGTFNNIAVAEQEKKIPSQFPVVMEFDGVETSNTIASEAGRQWEAEMKVRIRHAITEFKAIPDDFTNEDKFTV